MANAFVMNPDAIRSDYRQAANKAKQIDILANLNLCSPREIACLLRDLGEQLPMVWVNKLAKPERGSEEHRKKMSEAAKARAIKVKEERAARLSIMTVGVLQSLIKDLPEDCPIFLEDVDTPLRCVSFSRDYDTATELTQDHVLLRK